MLKVLIVLLSIALVAAVLVPRFRQEEEYRTVCRLHLERLMAAQETYFSQKGRYAEDLKEICGDTLEFVCPKDGSSFVLELSDSTHYKISCPNSHGWVADGKVSWSVSVESIHRSVGKASCGEEQ